MSNESVPPDHDRLLLIEHQLRELSASLKSLLLISESQVLIRERIVAIDTKLNGHLQLNGDTQVNSDTQVTDFRKPLGVGLTFDTDPQGRFRVANILAGGAADLSGHVSRGDILFSINGIHLRGRTSAGVAQLLEGPAGTRAALVLVSDPPSSGARDSILLPVSSGLFSNTSR